MASLESEQLALRREATPESGQGTVRPDDPVTGNHDRDGVAAVGRPDGPERIRVAEHPRDLAVGDGFAVGNLLKNGPDFELERSPGGRQRKIEPGELPRKIGFELANRLAKGLGVAGNAEGGESGEGGRAAEADGIGEGDGVGVEGGPTGATANDGPRTS